MRRHRVWRRARSMHATTFIGVLTALLAVAVLVVPLAGEAQQAASLPRIGLLGPGSLSDARNSRYLQAFRQGLRELGHVEGQNIAIEFSPVNAGPVEVTARALGLKLPASLLTRADRIVN